jgi:hypothetical protein
MKQKLLVVQYTTGENDFMPKNHYSTKAKQNDTKGWAD